MPSIHRCFVACFALLSCINYTAAFVPSTLRTTQIPPHTCRRRDVSVRMSEVAEVTNAGLLFAQLAGCGVLLGAGNKVRSEEEAEGVEEETETEGKEVDIFRDTAVRYLGYANECGEAFRPLIASWLVTASYGVAIAYVSADAIAKGFKCSKESNSSSCAFPATLDVLLFQMLASVVFPGFTINRWVTFVSYTLQQMHMDGSMPPLVYEYLPTAAGLALIPFIVKPLDSLVERMLDVTVRPVLLEKFPLCELQPIFGGEKDARE